MGLLTFADLGLWVRWWCIRIVGTPWRLWGVPGLVLICLVLAAGFATGAQLIIYKQLRVDVRTLDGLRRYDSQLNAGLPAQTPPDAVVAQIVAGGEQIQHLVERLTIAQQAAGVTSTGIEYLQQPIGGRSWVRYVLVFSVVGQGSNVERYLLNALATNPVVAVDSIQIAKDKGRPGIVEANVRLVLLVNSAERSHR